MSLYAKLRDRVTADLDSPSPAVKQLGTALVMLIIVLVGLLVPGMGFATPMLAATGIVVVGVATVVSLVFSRFWRLEKFSIVIPLIDIIGIGIFNAGAEGGVAFASTLLIPTIWIAAQKSRVNVGIVWIATCAALLIPNLIDMSWPDTSEGWVRVFIFPTIFMFAAGVINELSRQSRRQLEAINTMADDKERMLQRTVEYAAQLQESEAKYRTFDRMFRGVWAAVTEQAIVGTDVTGLIDAWNPGATKLLGPTAEEAEDKLHIFDFHLPEELEEFARELNYPPGETVLNPGFSALVENARLGRAESREWTYVRRDGSQVPVQLSVTKRVDDDGRTRGYLFVASDVTQAREVARLKDEFVGLISHELRTPLSSILGYLELMRDDEDNPLSEEHLQYLSVAERNAHRLLRLVGDLLFTAQVESGKFPLDARMVPLETIVTAALESAHPVADAAGIQLVGKLPDAPAVVHGDPVRLGQAVDNLISNAIKFTPRGGTVTIALDVTPEKALITVRDTGMGIAESELDKLFSRFFRATTATRNAVPGVGLGLTITKAIVTAHGGEMGVESQEGVGTCFSMSIPMSPVALQAH